ncbi:MAG: protein-lysine N-methyltransferase [Acidobacteria bacterium]|nr:protein-lysine N-methyltransferase [Acidobacteriota bacterium]
MTKGKRGFAVKRTATGLGLFTLHPIREGKRIIEYTGRLIHGAADNLSGRYLFALGEGLTIDGSPRSNRARYMNHSCNPNAEALYGGRRLWVYAKRDLESGEAITINYGQEYFDVFIKPKGCRCNECVAA